MKDTFGHESFIRCTKEAVWPRQAKFFCVHGGYCPFNIDFSFIKAKRAYVIVDGSSIGKQRYYTNICLHHNHEHYCTVIAGVTEVTLSIDSSEKKKDLLKHCALLNTRMTSVWHSLSKTFEKLTRIYDSQMLHCIITDKKNIIFGSDHHCIPELMK